MKPFFVAVALIGIIFFVPANDLFLNNKGETAWVTPLLNKISYQFEDGDLLFVNSQSIWSDIAKHFSQTDKRFGHVGVFFRDHEGQPKVIHAFGDPLNVTGKVRVDSLERFVASSKNLGWYGFEVDYEVRQAIVAQSLYYVQEGYVFNQGFELGKEGQLYCTELVWRAFLETQGVDLVPEKRNAFNRPFIGLDDLIRHPTVYERGYWSELDVSNTEI